MNIRRTIKMLSIAGAGLTVGAVLLPGTANSAAPGFGSWTVTNGNVSGCPSGYTCTDLVTGDGFRQAQVTDTSGNSFVWTVVTDTGATGCPPGSTSCTSGTASATGTVPFSDENFVVTNNSAVTGVADQQGITDNSNGNFSSSVNVLTGFAAPSSGNQVQINQSLTKDSGTPQAFSSGFTMNVALDSAGNQTGRSMNIDQSTSLNSTTDAQIFAIRARSGTFLTTAGSLTLSAATSGSGTGGTVSWNAGDDVMLAWVGQGLTLGSLGASKFGFESVTNNSTVPVTTASTFSQATTGAANDTNPFPWPSTDFGSQPTYP